MNEVKTQERIAKAWYLKQYLKQLEKLLIEEGCHTENDSQAFKQLLDLIERDTPKKITVDHDGEFSEAYCPNCHEFLDTTCIGDFCTECGQRLDWSEYWSE